VANVTHVTRT